MISLKSKFAPPYEKLPCSWNWSVPEEPEGFFVVPENDRLNSNSATKFSSVDILGKTKIKQVRRDGGAVWKWKDL